MITYLQEALLFSPVYKIDTSRSIEHSRLGAHLTLQAFIIGPLTPTPYNRLRLGAHSFKLNPPTKWREVCWPYFGLVVE